jgi:hypothetical protein
MAALAPSPAAMRACSSEALIVPPAAKIPGMLVSMDAVTLVLPKPVKSLVIVLQVKRVHRRLQDPAANMNQGQDPPLLRTPGTHRWIARNLSFW